MGRRLCALSTLVLLPLALLPGAAAGGRTSYIVVLNDWVKHPGDVARQHASEHAADIRFVYEHSITGYAAVVPDARIDAIRSDERVAYVAHDRPVSIAAQSLPTGIDRIDGELSSTAAGDGGGSVDVDIAIIDTGIDTKHPDLNVAGGKNCSSGKSYTDGNGHGSHVAGTAAATDDAQGVVGVAPGARLYAVRVLNNSGSGSWSSVICGVDWVTANASIIEVANMSLGGTGTEPAEAGCSTGSALHDAICRSVQAGVTYAVAAGNDGDDAARHVPAAYDEVITVSALADFDGLPGGLGAPTCRSDGDDTFADFSNYGADVDVIAPGVCILSTWNRGGYRTISGTSMASPHVAGAAALYKASNPAASPAQVQAALENNATAEWNNVDDGDAVKEGLLNVSTL